MPILVQAGSNEIEFPDGTPETEIKRALDQYFGEQETEEEKTEEAQPQLDLTGLQSIVEKQAQQQEGLVSEVGELTKALLASTEPKKVMATITRDEAGNMTNVEMQG